MSIKRITYYKKTTDTTIEFSHVFDRPVWLLSVTCAVSGQDDPNTAGQTEWERAGEVRILSYINRYESEYDTLVDTVMDCTKNTVWQGVRYMPAQSKLYMRYISPDVTLGLGLNRYVRFVIVYSTEPTVGAGMVFGGTQAVIPFPYHGQVEWLTGTATLVAGDNTLDVDLPINRVQVLAYGAVENPDAVSRAIRVRIVDAATKTKVFWSLGSGSVGAGDYFNALTYRPLGPLHDGLTIRIQWLSMTGGNTAGYAFMLVKYD